METPPVDALLSGSEGTRGVNIAIGCLTLLPAVATFHTTWAVLTGLVTTIGPGH